MSQSSHLLLEGTPWSIGTQLGTRCRHAIRRTIHQRFRLAASELASSTGAVSVATLRSYVRAYVRVSKRVAPWCFEELEGLAFAAGVEVADALFVVGYTDVIDHFMSRTRTGAGTGRGEVGCTAAIAVNPVGVEPRLLCGQTWDMPPGTSNIALLLERRYPDGLTTLGLTTVLGQTYCGINNHGVCVGTNNLATTRIGQGVPFSLLIHRALAEPSAAAAAESIKRTPRLSGHNYFVVDALGNAVNIETTGTTYAARRITEGVFAHANHYHDRRLRRYAVNYSASSRARESWTRRWLRSRMPRLVVDDLMKAWADHTAPICRHSTSPLAVATAAAVVFVPSEAAMYWTIGNPCRSRWSRRSLRRRDT